MISEIEKKLKEEELIVIRLIRQSFLEANKNRLYSLLQEIGPISVYDIITKTSIPSERRFVIIEGTKLSPNTSIYYTLNGIVLLLTNVSIVELDNPSDVLREMRNYKTTLKCTIQGIFREQIGECSIEVSPIVPRQLYSSSFPSSIDIMIMDMVSDGLTKLGYKRIECNQAHVYEKILR